MKSIAASQAREGDGVSNRFRVLKEARAAMLGLVLLAVSTGAARAAGGDAACGISDMFGAVTNSISDGYNFMTSHSKCTQYYSDEIFWVISGGLTIGTIESPDLKKACKDIEAFDATIKKWKDSVKSAQDKLSSAHDALAKFASPEDMAKIDGSLGDLQTYYQDAAAYAQELENYYNYIYCACAVATDSGAAQFTEFVGGCLVDLMCEWEEWVNGTSCQAQVPQLIDCRRDPCAPENLLWAADGTWSCDWNGKPALVSQGIPLDQKGDFFYNTIPAMGGGGQFCYCPSPMKMVDPLMSGQLNNPYYKICACPSGTHSAGGNPASGICLCNKTNLLPNQDGSCPKQVDLPPCSCSCANNQVLKASARKPDGTCQCDCGCAAGQVLADGVCGQPACAAAGNIRLADGSCCTAGQVSSCGLCCPSGQRPDAASGSCIAMGKPQRPPRPATPRPINLR